MQIIVLTLMIICLPFQSDKFKTDLFVMERVINLNSYQGKQALYRGFNIVKGKSILEISRIIKILWHGFRWSFIKSVTLWLWLNVNNKRLLLLYICLRMFLLNWFKLSYCQCTSARTLEAAYNIGEVFPNFKPQVWLF